ncbi:Aste57867_11244 [Aphanomyces stellatus]|uniref:Aste57867_11244 protein n=1 Tax=Aphanomyces stellatus TaxID=120398 RepID=A0A485KSG3_9STRA|nr:hypothetical protein As57867_011202 [Aphanomyces stellatus]VFT88110.1 Aste57867_11244 [Aphanomyces stellatus]
MRMAPWIYFSVAALVAVDSAAAAACDPIKSQGDNWCMNCAQVCVPLHDRMQFVVNGSPPTATTQGPIATNIATTGALSDGASVAVKTLEFDVANGTQFTFAFDTLKNLRQLDAVSLDKAIVKAISASDFTPQTTLSNITISNCKAPLAMDLSALPHLKTLSVLVVENVVIVVVCRTISNCTLGGVPKFNDAASLDTLKLVNVGLMDSLMEALARASSSASIDFSQNEFTVTAAFCTVIQQRNVKIDASLVAQCSTASSSFSDKTMAHIDTPSSTLSPSSSSTKAANPWNTVFTFIIVGVLASLVGVFVVHRRRLLHPAATTPGAASVVDPIEYLNTSTPMLETSITNTSDLLLSKMKEDVMLSEPLLTPFPPKFGRSYRLLPPKDVKVVARIPKAPTGLLAATHHGAPVTLRRLDYKDHDPTTVETFLTQLEVVATLLHPNVTRLVGATKLSGISVCAVFDQPPDALASILLDTHQSTPPLTWSQRLDLARGLADGVAYVHTHRPLLRLLTSATVSVRTKDLVCQVSTIAWLDDAQPTTADAALVRYGSYDMAATAPEVTRGDDDARAADVFALGIVLGEIATSKRPYAAWVDAVGPVAADARIHAVYADASAPLAPFEFSAETADPSCVAYEALVAACLARDPTTRPTAAHVATTLGSLRPTPPPSVLL